MESDYSRLDQDGCLIIRDAIDPGIYADFEQDVETLALSLLKRRGASAHGQEPMTALLRSAGELRKVLFPQLKNLRVLQDLEQRVSAFLAESGFIT